MSSGFARLLGAAQGSLGPARVRVQPGAPVFGGQELAADEPGPVQAAVPAPRPVQAAASAPAARVDVTERPPREVSAAPHHDQVRAEAPVPLLATFTVTAAPLITPASRAAPAVAAHAEMPRARDAGPPAPVPATPVVAHTVASTPAMAPVPLLPPAPPSREAHAPAALMPAAPRAARPTRATAQPHTTASPATEGEATVVHVSIGRVELIAAPPATAARPRSSPRASPRQSLAEYLGGKPR